MIEKDYAFYGTKVLNLKTQEFSLPICILGNKFADAETDYVTCVDKQGKRYYNVIIYEVLKRILRNKLTRKILEITYHEFRKKLQAKISMTFILIQNTVLYL